MIEHMKSPIFCPIAGVITMSFTVQNPEMSQYTYHPIGTGQEGRVVIIDVLYLNNKQQLIGQCGIVRIHCQQL